MKTMVILHAFYIHDFQFKKFYATYSCHFMKIYITYINILEIKLPVSEIVMVRLILSKSIRISNSRWEFSIIFSLVTCKYRTFSIASDAFDMSSRMKTSFSEYRLLATISSNFRVSAWNSWLSALPKNIQLTLMLLHLQFTTPLKYF